MIDLTLTDEQKLLVDNVRTFAAREFAPTIGENDSNQHFDPSIPSKLASLDLTGVCIPERYGGVGMDYISLGLACEELEYVDTTLRTVLSVHAGLVSLGIYQWGTEEQRRRWLPLLARGERFGAFGLTEPDAGSDAAGIKTTARRDGSEYVLDGQKIWISNAGFADLFLVFAKTDPAAGHEGMTAFVTERCEGLSTFLIKNKAGLRAGNTGGISLERVRIPEANRLGAEGEGFKIAMSCLDNGRYTVAAGATGLIRACLDASVRYANQRKAFGQEIGRFQLVQEMIAKMVSAYDCGRLLYLQAGWLKNRGVRSSRESALAKWFATVNAFQAASDAIEVHGAYGYSDEYPVARFLRNAKGSVIYEGTEEIHKLIQAQYALGYRVDRPVRCPLPPWEGAVVET